MKFLENKHYKKLQQLAKKPFDLRKKNALNQKRIESFQQTQDPFTLLYATERVDEEILQTLFALAKERKAVQKMRAMQSGHIVNTIEGYPSENRAVLHTAMRDFFSDRNPGKRAVIASTQEFEEFTKLQNFIKHLEKTPFQTMIQIGIGGSYLGPQAVYFALERYRKNGRSARFISNVDPDDAAKELQHIDLAKTLVVVVSKSGSTLETKTNELLVRNLYQKKGLDPRKHFISVTGKNSPMDNPAHYLQSFYMEDYVGGRYSATSMVGCVILGFAFGAKVVQEFLQGASAMDKIAALHDDERNLPLLSALLGIWNRNFLHYPTFAVIPYSQALHRLAAHLQQCDMESNGKSITKEGKKVTFPTGPIVWGEPGTSAQHSFYQWIHQGTDLASLEFIGFKKSQYEEDLRASGTTSQQKLLANMFAQSIALATGKQDKNPNKAFAGNRPNRLLLAHQLTPYVMGSLLAYYEHRIAFQGFIWNINSFDQEGVQLGKVLAGEILSYMKGENSTPKDPIKTYLECLDHL